MNSSSIGRKPIFKPLRLNHSLPCGEEVRVAAKFKLDGRMIPRTVKRMFDERAEERFPVGSSTAVLSVRGRRHVVRIVNTSPSGAMVIFPYEPHIGEQVSLQLID